MALDLQQLYARSFYFISNIISENYTYTVSFLYRYSLFSRLKVIKKDIPLDATANELGLMNILANGVS